MIHLALYIVATLIVVVVVVCVLSLIGAGLTVVGEMASAAIDRTLARLGRFLGRSTRTLAQWLQNRFNP